VLHYTPEGTTPEAARTAMRSLVLLQAAGRAVAFYDVALKAAEPTEETMLAGLPQATLWDALFPDPVDAHPFVPCEELPYDLCRTFWTAKLGNAATEWEDGYAIDAASHVVAVADGASEGIFCRAWAGLLARTAAAALPEAHAFAPWIAAAKQAWKGDIQYATLRWSQQAKADDVGAAATLLVLALGPTNAHGERPWRAMAVGDACLFWIRDNRIRASFPLVAAKHLSAPPVLVRTKPGPAPRPLIADGICRPGDRFALVTDAVAGQIFNAGELDWARYDALAEDAWTHEAEAARREGSMVNDDCTMILLQVAAAKEPA
jgi:hypothetical protein